MVSLCYKLDTLGELSFLTAIDILRNLKDMPRLTPILMEKKMKRPASVIRNVLVILVELGLVRSVARGLYELTPEGEEILERTEKRHKRRFLTLEESIFEQSLTEQAGQ